MQRIIYVPPTGHIDQPETCAEFSLSPPYIIGSVFGTGNAETTVLSSAVPGVDGSFVQGLRIENRQITCFVHVQGAGRRQMYEERFRLAKLLAPSETPGYLYYANDFTMMRIQAIPVSSPTFTDRIKNYNRAELTFLCPSPYWESLSESTGQMAYLDQGFVFPFSFDISFAAMQNDIVIQNNGSANTPVEISIRGPAKNPAVINETTGERIGILHELTETETLKINTAKGRKSVLISSDSGDQDAFHYIDLQSVFFSLAPGQNLLRYESDDETKRTQVMIRYRELYTGV